MDERTKLTQKTVAAIEPLEGAQRLVRDSELRGFGLRIAPAGTKSYVMQRRVNGRSRRVTIGRADDMKAEQARKKALVIASQFAEGHDPVRERELLKAREMTLRDYVFSDREGDVPSDLRATYKRIEVATGLWIA